MKPDPKARTIDELHLALLNCWEVGWTHGEIARTFPITRAASVGVVHRINKADPDAILRKPEPYRRAS